MQPRPGSSTPSSRPVRTSIVVVVGLGFLGLLTITQWTARTVRKHVEVASRCLFPAALKSQEATSEFERMNREYRDAFVLQEKTRLAGASRDAAEVASALDSAGRLMAFDSRQQGQIYSLKGRIGDFHARSQGGYTAAVSAGLVLPKALETNLADLWDESQVLQKSLESLQRDLAGDFSAELALIDRLLRIQEACEVALLSAFIIALYFSVRASINATVRRQQDEFLHQVHRDNENLLNSVPSLLIGLDTYGRIRQWNKAATKILGWESGTIKGKTLDECGVKWLTPNMSARVAARVQSPEGNNLDNIKLEKSGVTRFLGLDAIRLETNDGTAPGILVVGADITERIGLEEQLRQAQKLESIGQLAAGIAHEINTPTQYIGDNVRFLNKRHLDRTHAFYERYGGKTIVIARFVPIVRTFAPFVAGIGKMTYARFLAYNVAGGIAWVLLFVLGGFYFGNIPIVRRNFSLVIIAIIVISVMPAVIEVIRQRRAAARG